jgi:hypothetical protein
MLLCLNMQIDIFGDHLAFARYAVIEIMLAACLVGSLVLAVYVGFHFGLAVLRLHPPKSSCLLIGHKIRIILLTADPRNSTL